MDHLRLLLYLLLLAPGFAGVTVTAILHHRIRDRLLLYVLIVILAFTAGLLLFVILYYVEVIARVGIDLGFIVSLVNLCIVVLMYGCLAFVAAQLAPSGAVWPLAPLALLVVANYLVFGALTDFNTSVANWAASHATAVELISVGSASAYLAYSATLFLSNAGKPAHPNVRFLIRTLGWMLLVFSVLAVLTTALAEIAGLDLEPTAYLNFVLYLAWNVTAIIGFLRYLTHPADVFGEEGIPDAAIRRYGISNREAEVILQLSRGLSNKEIADRLHVSYTTVRTHIYNVFKKTGAGSRVELLRILSGG